MEDKDILSYSEYNFAIVTLYFLFFIVTALMVFIDYKIIFLIKFISDFWFIPIFWILSFIPSVACLFYLHLLYYERDKLYTTKFIVERKNIND